MGTHSLIIVSNNSGHIYTIIYQQFDGYLNGVGIHLTNFLSGFKIGTFTFIISNNYFVNGLSDMGRNKIANGAGCLAAQIVAHFKTEPGGTYLESLGSRSLTELFKSEGFLFF